MAIPIPFLVVLISWLAIIFASFSLFADSNSTTIVALSIFALSAALCYRSHPERFDDVCTFCLSGVEHRGLHPSGFGHGVFAPPQVQRH